MKRNDDKNLPPFAVEYLDAARASRRIVRWFHAWIKQSGRAILQLEPREIDIFLAPRLATQKPSVARALRRRLLHYFEWLRARGIFPFDPRILWPRGNELPPLAVRFTKQLEPTHKPSTVAQHRNALRQFHVWLESQTLTLDTINRQQMSAWLQWLHTRNLMACSRVHIIGSVRAYFRWLEEQSDYAGPPGDDLLRASDFPKLPQYLPRPIPDDLDRILQRRLRKSQNIAWLGLLLMRRTGIRIGELRALPFHCVHSDHRDRQFLKVPLGKLNTERLVPLDRKTIRVIERLRAGGSLGRRGKRRTLLLQKPSGARMAYEELRLALEKACRGLVFAEPMTSHRLRHTYATTMLAAGVSIPVLMKLLGHHSHRMTLRYAAVTIETITTEYVDAIDTIEQRYNLHASVTDTTAPERSLTDLARYLIKHAEDAGLDKARARAVAHRLHRLNTVVQRLLRDCARQSRRPE